VRMFASSFWGTTGTFVSALLVAGFLRALLDVSIRKGFKMVSGDQVAELRAVFDQLDVDKSGAISQDEFAKYHAGLSRLQQQDKFVEADKDKSGTVDFEEFVALHDENDNQTKGMETGMANFSGVCWKRPMVGS